MTQVSVFGSTLESSQRGELLDSRASRSSTPFMVILDDYGYFMPEDAAFHTRQPPGAVLRAAPANCTFLTAGHTASVASASAEPGRKTDAATPADIPTNARSSTMSNENTPAAESNRPALRNKDDVALWPAKPGSTHHLSGHITVDGKKTNVIGFINDTDRDGNALKQSYVALSRNTSAEGEAPKWETVASGNAMNHRSDDKPVYFDEMIFNIKGQDKKTFTAFVGKGCPAEFQQQLGFTSPVVDRPAKAEAAAADEAEEEEADCPRP